MKPSEIVIGLLLMSFFVMALGSFNLYGDIRFGVVNATDFSQFSQNNSLFTTANNSYTTGRTGTTESGGIIGIIFNPAGNLILNIFNYYDYFNNFVSYGIIMMGIPMPGWISYFLTIIIAVVVLFAILNVFIWGKNV